MHDAKPYVDMSPKAVEVREKFVVFLSKMLELVDSKDSLARAKKILELETAVAVASRPDDQEADDAKADRTWTIAELEKQAPGFDWAAYLESNGIQPATPLVIGQPDVIRNVAKVLADTDLRTLKDHLAFSVICTWGWVGALPQSIYDLQFDFYARVRRGATQQPERKERAYTYLRRVLPADIDALYAARYPGEGSASAQLSTTDGPKILPDEVYGNAKRAHAWNWAREVERLKAGR